MVMKLLLLFFKDPSFLSSFKKFSPQVLKDILFYAKFFSFNFYVYIYDSFIYDFLEVMTNLDSVLKSTDITLLTKVCIVKAMVFSVVTFTCDGWAIKKAE